MKLNTKFIEHGIIETDSLIPLIREIENDTELWNDAFRAKHYIAQKNTQNIAFTWTPILDKNIFSVYTNKRLLETKIGKVYTEFTNKILNFVPGVVLRGAIVRMIPKSKIYYHLDGSHELWKNCHRIHLPIITEPEIEFHYKFLSSDDKSMKHVSRHLSKDMLVEIDNFIPHGVSHDGNFLRYHLLYDILDVNYNGPFKVVHHDDENTFTTDRLSEIHDHKKYCSLIDQNLYSFG